MIALIAVSCTHNDAIFPKEVPRLMSLSLYAMSFSPDIHFVVVENGSYPFFKLSKEVYHQLTNSH